MYQISIDKNNQIISDGLDFYEESNTFFENAVRPLNVKPDEFYSSDKKDVSDPVEISIKKFGNILSVLAINQNILINQNLNFFSLSVIVSVIDFKNS